MIPTFVVVNAILFAILYWGRTKVRDFLRSVKSISAESDLVAYKIMVRRQMLAVVALVPLALLSFAMVIALNYYEGLIGAAVVLSICLPMFYFARASKKVESEARSLPCIDTLLAEYSAVSVAWQKKLFPNF